MLSGSVVSIKRCRRKIVDSVALAFANPTTREQLLISLRFDATQ